MPAANRPQPGRGKPRPKAAPTANRAKQVPAAVTPRPGGQPARTARTDAATPVADADQERGGVLGWISVLVLCAIAVLCALLELMLIPLYIGSVIIPVSVVAALASNIALPWWGYRALGRGIGAALPVIVWLVVLLGLSVVQRPEGDLFVTAGYNQSWVYYGVILLGAVAGFTTLLRLTSPR